MGREGRETPFSRLKKIRSTLSFLILSLPTIFRNQQSYSYLNPKDRSLLFFYSHSLYLLHIHYNHLFSLVTKFDFKTLATNSNMVAQLPVIAGNLFKGGALTAMIALVSGVGE